MPLLTETNLLSILLVPYINFQLLENKWRNSRSQNDVSNWRRHGEVPREQNSWLHYR